MPLSFAQIGQVYNAITDEVTGGVSPLNKGLLLAQVNIVQQGVQTLVNNGTFTDGATITHAQNIADQMNFLKQQINQFGTNAFNPKFINDVVRDVQDIVASDDNLAAMAAPTHGFQQVSNLLTQPTPFPDTPLQTDTLLKFIDNSNALAAKAIDVAKAGFNADAVNTLVTDIHDFSVAADAYSTAQGGLFSARFNNEFTLNGVQGTASRELIKGLQTGDMNLVNGAADVLMANANDVRGNMLVQGDTFTPVPNGGIPDQIPDLKTAGMVFNDAATKLIGGVYSGNQQSIVNDLKATVTGVQNTITDQKLTGQALADAQKVIGLLNHEAGLVNGINTANPTPVALVNSQIGLDQAAILGIVNHDQTLANLADGGFAPNPPILNQGMRMAAGTPPVVTPPAPPAAHGDGLDMAHAHIDFSHMWHFG